MENMLNIIDDDEAEDAQKRRNAANNILVLAREEATANQLCAKGGVGKLKDMLEDDDREVKLAAVRALVREREGRVAREPKRDRDSLPERGASERPTLEVKQTEAEKDSCSYK